MDSDSNLSLTLAQVSFNHVELQVIIFPEPFGIIRA